MGADLQAARAANSEAREDLKRALWALKRFRQTRPSWDHVDQETHDELKAAFWAAKARAKDAFIAMAIAAVAS